MSLPDLEHKYPYTPGSNVWLQSSSRRMIQAKIIEVKALTLSCVMVIQPSSSTELIVLKLYDRRFSHQLRRDEEALPWNTQIENCYRQYLQSGHQHMLFERWSVGFQENQYWEDDTREQWDQVTLETYLQFLCQMAYRTEKKAYDLMSDIQGLHVPKLYDEVTLHSSQNPTSEKPDRYLDCPGILLQYLRGFPLSDLDKKVAPECWQSICDGAIDIIHQIGDRGICNKDVKTRSFILVYLHSTSLRVFMIDFGLCSFKDQAKDDQEFREWQADQDEEGAIGCVMERHLKGRYNYRRSARAESLLNEFKRGE